jgi:replicative DNA helicase
LPPGDLTVDVNSQPWLTPAAEFLHTLVEHFHSDQPEPEPVATGIAGIDEPLGDGLSPGTLTALVATTKADAATTLIDAALHAADHRRLTLFYPLGDTYRRLAARLAVASGVNPAHLNAGCAGEHELDVLSDAAQRLRHSTLYLSVGTPISVHDIRADALGLDTAPQLIVVDKLPLLLPDGRPRDLKHLAVDLNVAVLCSTTIPADPTQPPSLADVPADLLETADAILALHCTPHGITPLHVPATEL